MILVIDLIFPPSQENRGDAGKACIWRMTISNRSRMDWRMTSLGLLLDTIPCWWLVALGQAGFTWWNSGTFFVVPVIISCAVIVTTIGLAKRGPLGSFSESDLVVVSAGIGLLVIFFGILPINLTAISYSWHCLESGLPWFCDKASAINSLAWIWLTLLLAPAMAFFGAILFALRKRT